ncbi:ribosomal maturation YjgA family protein [Seonamhaeicola maritimus]|uniref:DUF2809 domain-containing protein n=1 Tax=Seonamhaeicola maritimus TaxID=2591822 RepID=A0A5C7GK14_9FLAO|nr:DUF2809 domain-containing protein [Seonamhaeicola maritimus]TXG38759.1 DUF2809 domain-containing protein [Seonamhaeicola maritimus]
MKLNKTYIMLTILILTIEILIATYLKTGLIRHTFGDFLATILLYSIVRSFIKVNALKLGVSVLIFSFSIEFIQLLNILDLLNIQNKIIRIILGTSFQFSDLMAYTLGIITIVIVDLKILKNEQHKTTHI